MRVAFDAVTLSAYFYPGATYPQPIDRIPERLKLLVEELEAANAKIIVPTPVLSEFLVLADADGPLYLSELTNNDVFEIQPFDTVAAVEAARVQVKAMAEGDKKSGTSERWQVVKVDRQFVAIAKVHGVTTIYSDDKDVRKLAAVEGIAVKGVGDLPTPPPPAPEAGDLFQDDGRQLRTFRLPPRRHRLHGNLPTTSRCERVPSSRAALEPTTSSERHG